MDAGADSTTAPVALPGLSSAAEQRGGSGSSTDATLVTMESVGLRELRQDASSVIRRVEAGEEIAVTVSGRLVARIVPAAPREWRRWGDVAELFTGRPDPDWERDRDVIDQAVGDPWERNP